ncbi:asparagine synthase (glutamine-hydrolyzing) [Mangrovimonas sp. CR14]|uniref:asparagine synthase (glutamine-hydrolyzing) n=1 Tax=Mangrovimonas sp. CR14 TaxID=2706120 RepID=UPI001422FF0A|nr:asparagine synthase (glutamine-hydrolyzing) [Mangrovimonas sp. CR14]NIK91893.1 asparagine synthase (glutamine-hydrolyzing) [Mangrovimonas sp. CR14]
MCGIYGSTKIYEPDQVQKKLERTNFRGPDKLQHININNKVVFGHNRLAIVDLDERSNQPFTYHHVHIVFNGEIYNFLSLKDELVLKGYSFRTTSDTEVICAAYLEYGNECVNKFNGMFAFVIYDEKNNILFGARDRLGQKPFYYYHNKGHFEFASQLAPIQLYNSDLTISSKSISYYLAWGDVPDPYSIFNEVKKLPPGNHFTYQLDSYNLTIKPYWNISTKHTPYFQGSFEEAKEELKSVLKDAVKMRLFADVPVGVFLSGGVDSSVIAAMATQTTESKIKTFSVKFNEKKFDESIYAQQVANHLKTDHHVIECNYEEGIDLIDNFSYYYDEPFADSSAIPSMLLSKYTRDQVTVALSGDAGDENFIGYERYVWIKKGKMAFMLPKPARQLASKILQLPSNYRIKTIGKVLNFNDVNDIYIAGMTGVDTSWIDSDFNYLEVDELKYLKHKEKNIYERMSDFDLKTYLNWDINTKVDRATMAYSLEARSPLMDYRIVEFARSLPTEYKIQGKNQKRILKEVLYDYVPKEIFDRPKAGFTMPFQEWFRGTLKDYVLSELSDSELNNIPNINTKEVSLRINQHMDGSWNRYPLIWKLLVLKQWLSKNGKGYSIK